MKGFVLLILLSFIGIEAYSQKNEIEKVVAEFVDNQELNHASISITIRNHEGDIVGGENNFTSLPTASTAKLFATASALEILGPDYKAKTRIYIEGIISEDGILNGNVWIRGGGDPTLGSKYFNETAHKMDFILAWTKAIENAGIKQIKGAIIADASEFGYLSAPDAWTWNDMGNYYGAGPSGLTVFDNTVEYHFKTSKYNGGESEITALSPPVNRLRIMNEVKSANINYDNSYIYGAPYSLDRIATGSLPIGRSDFIVKGSLPDPEQTIGEILFDVLLDRGITCQEEVHAMRNMKNINPDYSKMSLLHTEYGQPLNEIIKLTNYKSINLFAEHLVCLIAYEKGMVGSVNNGIEYISKYWESKIDTKGLYLTDGSGLSRSNGISSAHLTDLLHFMHNESEYSKEFYASLPVSGESGTLRSLCRNQPGQGRIHAKSGTMNRIKSYAGYIESSSGEHYSFAIIANNFDGSISSVKKKMEKLLNSLSAF
jgi:D-alanyl-D-alanine carboxypeptidase/D-alanyl-D-alanine-endopeptidase (penicillin-binding protein 4)